MSQLTQTEPRDEVRHALSPIRLYNSGEAATGVHEGLNLPHLPKQSHSCRDLNRDSLSHQRLIVFEISQSLQI